MPMKEVVSLALGSDQDRGHGSQPSRLSAPPLIMEAASKVDKCLARLQSLQGTVTLPIAPVRSASVSSYRSASNPACMSPTFSRSRSCIPGSPKIQQDDKIRVHDILRWSDDFSGKFKQERRDKYIKRLSRSKTEVFDDKKDPLDPHGEWKHWSSPAGDVHKVISEILMASQIAKQITSMVNAALVQTDVSSDDEEPSSCHRPRKDLAAQPNGRASQRVQNKKDDPLHKFRIVVATDGPAKKRSNAGTRNEVLYPKSKQVPDLVRPANENQAMSSVAKKMQSRRSSGAAGMEPRARDMWAAKEITNRKCPSQDSRKTVTANENLPSTVKRIQNTRSPPRSLTAETRMGSKSETKVGTMSESRVGIKSETRMGTKSMGVKPPAKVRQTNRSKGFPIQESGKLRQFDSTATNAVSSEKTVKTNLPEMSSEASVVSSRSRQSAEAEVVTASAVLLASAVSEIQTHNLAPLSSEVPELKKSSVVPCCKLPAPIIGKSGEKTFSSQLEAVASDQSTRVDHLMGSLRHKFVMEATEIKGPKKPWRLNQSKSRKAVLFSNPAFAPSSPPGARPASEARSNCPTKIPSRTSSATRRMIGRIGQALTTRGRSLSPDIYRRFDSTRRKLTSLSPGKSLPALISRLPSRGKKPSTASAPRGTIQKTPCTRPAPVSGELPLPPGRKGQHQQKVGVTNHASIAEHMEKDVGAPAPGLSLKPGPTLLTVRQLKDMDCNARSHAKGADLASKKANSVKCHSGPGWDDEVGVIGVLSSCRKWVEESAPPLPVGGIYMNENSVSAIQKENMAPAFWDNEVGVTNVFSSCRGIDANKTGPAVATPVGGIYMKENSVSAIQKENMAPACWDNEVGVTNVLSSCRGIDTNKTGPAVATPELLKRSWSTGSRSFSTGKVRAPGAGPSFLRKARDWIRTQTPFRDRPQHSQMAHDIKMGAHAYR